MNDEHTILTAEQALAFRIVRMQTVPHEFWLWSHGNLKTSVERVSQWVDPSVSQAIRAIIEPSLKDANAWERQQSHAAEAWISGIFGFVSARGRELNLNSRRRMLAAAILPLYRGLACGNLHEALDQTRLRLAETLAIIGVAEHLEADFVQLIEPAGTNSIVPHATIKNCLKVDLKSLSWLCRQSTRHFDSLTGKFDEDLIAQLRSASSKDGSRLDCAWADPALLWQISGELQAAKAELVLPRPWVDTPLPWTKISEHWTSLAQLLDHPPSRKAPVMIGAASKFEGTDSAGSNRSGVTQSAGDNQSLHASCNFAEDDLVVTKIVDDLVGMQADFADAMGQDFIADDEPAQEVVGYQHAAHELNQSAPKMDTDNDSFAAEENDHLSKIVLAEINSNSDPLFVSVVRRQIATAGNEDRTVCLVALQVTSDDSLESSRLSQNRDTGLALWQEKLVNWLGNHPEVHEPHAFITLEGELVLCFLDVERSLATNLVREGLEYVLGGKSNDNDSSSALSRVAIPARYYSGIGSVTAPNASFSAEQLIAATWRCLSASQCQGKSAIKSIECY